MLQMMINGKLSKKRLLNYIYFAVSGLFHCITAYIYYIYLDNGNFSGLFEGKSDTKTDVRCITDYDRCYFSDKIRNDRVVQLLI